MKARIEFFFLLCGLFAAAAGQAAAAGPDCSLRYAPAEQTIKSVATRDQGREFCQYRIYESTLDLDGDKKTDLVMTFAVEGVGGSNQGTREYLMAFPSTMKYKPLTVLAGELPIRQVNRIKDVRERRITLELAVFQQADSLCCPSGKGTAVFELRDGGLVELKADELK